MKSGFNMAALGRRAVGLAAIASLLATGGALSVHAAPAHDAITITLWGNYSGPDQNGVKAIVAGFNASQNVYNVQYDEQSFNNYGQRLATALSAGKGPDMWDTDNTTMTQYASQGVLQPLDSAIKGYSALQPSNYSKSIWQGGKYQGHLYAIPLDVLPLTFYYNKALFRKAGLNPNKPPIGSLSQFVSAAKKLTHGNQWGFVMAPAWPQPFIFQSYIAQFGGKMFDTKTNQATVNSAAGVKALTVMWDMIYKYKVSPPNTAVDQDLKMLGNGTAAMILDGPWEYTNPALQALGKNLGYSVIPKWGNKKAVFLGTHYLVTYGKNTSADKTKGEMAFATYWVKHTIFMAKEGDTPAYLPVVHSAAFKKLDFQKAIAPSLKYGILSPNFPHYQDSFVYDAITSVLTGKTNDIKGALTSAAQKMTQAAQGS